MKIMQSEMKIIAEHTFDPPLCAEAGDEVLLHWTRTNKKTGEQVKRCVCRAILSKGRTFHRAIVFEAVLSDGAMGVGGMFIDASGVS